MRAIIDMDNMVIKLKTERWGLRFSDPTPLSDINTHFFGSMGPVRLSASPYGPQDS